MAGSLDGKRPGRKPLPPDRRLVRVTAYITAEQEVYCKARGNGSAVRGLRELVRLAMAGGETPAADPPRPEAAESPAAKPGGKARMCERCRRLGMPSCPMCCKIMGHT